MNDLILKKKTEYDLPFSYEVYVPSQNVISTTNKAVGGVQLIPADYKPIEHEDMCSADFDSSVLEADKWDYLVAAASGMLAASLNIVWVGDLSLTEARSWGEKEVNKFVMRVARTQGYKGTSLAGAIKKLEDTFPIPGDKITPEMGGGLQHHLRDFTHHPTIVGLAFSILTQFTGYGYGTNTAGDFIKVEIPNGDCIGKNVCEKIFYGTAIWAFHLISDMAGSNQTAGAGTGIPGYILSTLKELSSLPFVKELKVKYKDDDIGLSVWVSKLFNGTLFRSEENPKGIRFDLRTEMGLMYQIGKQAVPVIANECVVRSFYLLRHLYLEIKNKKVHSLSEFRNLSADAILPFNNRTITHMTTVSSGVFFAITTATAAVRAGLKNKGNKEGFAKDFLLSVNYVGVGRFAFALYAEGKYVVKDIKKLYEEYRKREDGSYKESVNLEAFEYLTLTPNQALILQSLKKEKVLYDIQGSKNEAQQTLKEDWFHRWYKKLQSEVSDADAPVVYSTEEIYCAIHSEVAAQSDLSWLYLIALELLLYQPYFELEESDDDKYKKLKCKTDYARDVFCKRQEILSYDDYVAIRKTYAKAVSDMKNQTTKTVVTVSASLAATAATGGAALAFAPQIAVTLAGGSLAGLSGAALTNASLALIGGGSLAAGGLGMAGGTAIITGGGALLGVIGSSAASYATLSMLSSKEYALGECSKLLTVCRYILIDKLENKEAVRAIKSEIERCADKLSYELTESTDMDKKKQKQQKACIDYLERCGKLLEKCIK